MVHSYLFHLLYYRFGKYGFWITIPNVVSVFEVDIESIKCIRYMLTFCYHLCRFPFVWRNPFGFLIAIVIQYTMISYASMIGACVIAFALGFYLYTIAMTKCIKGSLFSINRNAQLKIKRKCIFKQLVEFIEFHSKVKQLSVLLKFFDKIFWKLLTSYSLIISFISDFSDFFQHFLTLLFIWSLITICGVLLKIQIDVVKYCFKLHFIMFASKYS